jgi:hypothetical protein
MLVMAGEPSVVSGHGSLPQTSVYKITPIIYKNKFLKKEEKVRRVGYEGISHLPMLQISISGPTYLIFLIISGATYDTEPQKVENLSPGTIIFENPKSDKPISTLTSFLPLPPHTINFNIPIYIKQQILWLQITMDDQTRVAILHSTYDLAKELTCLFLPKPPARNNLEDVSMKIQI